MNNNNIYTNNLRPDKSQINDTPIGGILFFKNSNLAANGSFSTIGLLDANGNSLANSNGYINIKDYQSAVATIISDVSGVVTYEYSVDGIIGIETINGNYVSLNESRISRFNLRSYPFIKVSYTNGTTAQTKFLYSLSLSNENKVSAQSINSQYTRGLVAEITKTSLVATDVIGTGTFSELTQTNNALDVNIKSGTQVSIGIGTHVSGTINLANTAQTLITILPTNKYFEIQNRSDTDMIISFNTLASATNGIKIKGDPSGIGGYYSMPTNIVLTGTVSIFCSLAGKAFTYLTI